MTSPETAPASTAGPAHTPIVTDLMRLMRAPFSPGDVFGEQQDRPTFWWPWAIVSAVWIVLQFLQKPFQQRAQELIMAQRGITPPAAAGAGAVSYVMGVVGGALTVLVICALSAGILYLLMAAFGGEATYKKMLTVSIFAFPVTLLSQLLTFVVLTMRGADAIRGPWDLMVSFGVDLLIPADAQVSGFLRIFLAGISPFSIWAMAITAVGLMTLAKAGKGAAWAAAAISMLIGLAIGAGIGAWGMSMMGG